MESFQKVYEEYAKPVYRFLLSLTCNQDLAEELLSETFYQAFRHIDQFEGRCNLYTWLCRIGKNAWLKECCRNKRYSDVQLEDLKLSDMGPSLEDQCITKEIAGMYGKTESWARVTYFRAKQQIVQEVKNESRL